MVEKYTILCVEDEIDIRNELVFGLTKYGYKVFPAANGEEALQMLADMKPDLILSDVLMPGLGGLELLKRIRSLCPHLISVPFIFLSALGSRSDLLEGLDLGADDYLIKPIDLELLSSKIKRSLNLVERVKNTTQTPVSEVAAKLSKREIEVLMQFALGYTNAKVAENLGLSEYTVGDHAKSIFRKLNVKTRTQALQVALSHGMITSNR